MSASLPVVFGWISVMAPVVRGPTRPGPAGTPVWARALAGSVMGSVMGRSTANAAAEKRI
ncbi:hypothetical protein GCM10007890_27500 [Methylobacterium tardum]|uniref:Uncharacterized protein n=1 Tax=Methylobacterium tardum TaxID=374432 RepID=A0AA37WSU3_9HYPH|nr:hypothetical protein GCM10007890_27500 [Methylobacterium tardum]